MRSGTSPLRISMTPLIMNFCPDHFPSELQTDAGQVEEPILAAPRVNATGRQTTQETEESPGRGKHGDVNAEFEAGFAGLGGHLDGTVGVNGPNLLARQFPDFLAFHANKQLIAPLANLRARSLHHQDFSFVILWARRLERGRFFA